jgi:hypothetical protein
MKLSEELYNDFLKDVQIIPNTEVWSKKTISYPMSYDYLIDLIEKVKELEALNEKQR